jgi:hypothetical protein
MLLVVNNDDAVDEDGEEKKLDGTIDDDNEDDGHDDKDDDHRNDSGVAKAAAATPSSWMLGGDGIGVSWSKRFRTTTRATPSLPGRPRRRNPNLNTATTVHSSSQGLLLVSPSSNGSITTNTTDIPSPSRQQQQKRRIKRGRHPMRPQQQSYTLYNSILLYGTKVIQSFNSYSTLLFAVLLWYSLGVVSISTSKLLLTPPPTTSISHQNQYPQEYDTEYKYYHHVGGVPPLLLTLQQLLLGCTILRCLLQIQFMSSPGIHPIERLLSIQLPSSSSSSSTTNNNTSISNKKKMVHDNKVSSSSTAANVPVSSILQAILKALTASSSSSSSNNNNNSTLVATKYLIYSGMYFAFGFLTTNLAFGTASPTYVETVKSAEPITSAFLAVTWGIETLSTLEVSSLGGIVLGVLLSTMSSSSSSTGSSDGTSSTTTSLSSSLSSTSNNNQQLVLQSIIACCIVMVSNLCFSFRGLYQKLYRNMMSSMSSSSKTGTSAIAIPLGTSTTSTTTLTTTTHYQLDDLNLQYRMQQIGVLLFILPTILLDGPTILYHWYKITMVVVVGSGSPTTTTTTIYSPLIDVLSMIVKYTVLSIGNGLAFTTYK